MSKLRIRPSGRYGRVLDVTPQSAGWTHVGFELHRLRPGETAAAATGDREACLVFVSGKGAARAGSEDFGSLGGRATRDRNTPHVHHDVARDGAEGDVVRRDRHVVETPAEHLR